MDLHDLPRRFGTEVRGLDLRRPLEDDQIERLRDTFDGRHLLLFRAQHVTGEEQVRVCRHFGPISFEHPDGYGYVSNVHPNGVLREGALLFHSDLAFTPEPVLALSLHALEVPRHGAPTIYADAVGVLDGMDPALRRALEAVRIVNVYDFTLPTGERMRERDLAPGSPVVERPMVGAHPRTGVPVVNANAMQTDRIVGLPERDSEALLTELFEALYAPANTFVLDWRVGDLAIWDNVALQHHRPDFTAVEPRTMQRVCIHHKTLRDLVPNVGELLGR
jgi:taurine dioxygenase